jgi:hypothetical protein
MRRRRGPGKGPASKATNGAATRQRRHMRRPSRPQTQLMPIVAIQLGATIGLAASDRLDTILLVH